MTDILDEVNKLNTSSISAKIQIERHHDNSQRPQYDFRYATTVAPRTTESTPQTSPVEENFETPPTSPSHLRDDIFSTIDSKSPETALRNETTGLGARSESSMIEAGKSDSLFMKKPEFVPFSNRKRALLDPDPIRSLPPRKMSRDTKGHSSNFNVSGLAPTSSSNSSEQMMAAPPTHDTTDPIIQANLTSMDTSGLPPAHAMHSFARVTNGTAPMPPPSDRSSSLSRSSDNIPSISSSMTSASPAWTSPNTSFSSTSLNTSFASSADGHDANTSTQPDIRYDSNTILNPRVHKIFPLRPATSGATQGVEARVADRLVSQSPFSRF